MKVTTNLLLFLLLQFFLGCNEKEEINSSEMYRWALYGSASSFIKEMLQRINTTDVDNSWYVLFRLQPDESLGKTFDVTKVGVGSKEEYDQRMQQLNFELKELVYLEEEKRRVHPVLYTMENTYGMHNWRDFLFVFPKKEDASSIKLVFNDEIYNTGINKFNLNTES